MAECPPLLYIAAGYLLSLVTVYVTASCTRRLSSGRPLPLIPLLRRKAQTSDETSTYQNPYGSYRP